MAAAMLAACGDDHPPAAAPAPDSRLRAALEAAEVPLRARLRASGDLQQRGVQVFAQAIPNTFAVCGRAMASGSASEPLLPWVAVVSVGAGSAQVSSFVLGASGPEATRVFTELVDRCFEGGGPTNSRMPARPLPPLPTPAPPEASRATVSDAPPATPPEPAAGLRSVVTSARSGANLRTAPRGGEILRTVPRSTTLEVLGEAAGGWYQVGQNGTAWGWVHSSVLERTDR